MQASPTAAPPAFDPSRLVAQFFGYAKHLRLMLVVLCIGLLAGITYFLYATPLFSAISLVQVRSFGTPVADPGLPETGMGAPNSSLIGLLNRLQSADVRLAAARRLGVMVDDPRGIDVLREEHIPMLRIDIVDYRHLQIQVEAYEPHVVRGYAKALVESYLELQEEGWRTFRDEAMERFSIQLTELEAKVSENLDALNSLENESNFTELTIEQQSLLEIPRQLVETREKITRMDALRKNIESYERDPSSDHTITILSLLANYQKEAEVSVGNVINRPLAATQTGVAAAAPPRVQVVTPADVESLEPWQELEREQRGLEARITEASALFLPDHPKMREMTGQLEEVRRSLGLELANLREKFELEYRRLTEKLAELQRRLPEYEEVTREFGKTNLTYSSIEQAQLMWNEARKRLAGKLAVATFTEDIDWVNIDYVGHVQLRDRNPISPNKRKLVMLSLLLGLGGGLGLSTALNLLDNSATSLAQLEGYIGVRGIGIVPLTDPGYLEAVHRSPAQGATVPNYLLECFRVIRANIGLDSRFEGRRSQVILVTSARPQEGKTTQTANLAWAFRSMGEKVLVVDCDLRRGRQHVLLGLDNSAGMSHMLTGRITPEQAVVPTGPQGFHAIARGPIIPGSTELLCQEGFARLVEFWRTRYDRILLDCPPVLGLSESASLQRLADGIVLVVRSETTAMKDVRDAVTVLRKTGAHFFGFVLNSVDLSKIGNYYQYYYYSAPYYDQFEGDDKEEDSSRSAGGPIPRVVPAP